MRKKLLFVLSAFWVLSLVQGAVGATSRKVAVQVRGIKQTLHFFAPDSRRPEDPGVLVVSGDGGWHGFIIDIAQHLSARGLPAVGLDAKAYLESMSKPKALEPAQVASDFAVFERFTKEQTGAKSIVLVGWSEGAGLAVLGGLDPTVRADLSGVVAIGLPELNELAWRWRDSVIYLTHKVPNEPTFNSKDYVGRLAPVPLVTIQSNHDEFVPRETAREIFAQAREPKQIAWIDADGHHFEGHLPAFWQALDRAFAWFEALTAMPRN